MWLTRLLYTVDNIIILTNKPGQPLFWYTLHIVMFVLKEEISKWLVPCHNFIENSIIVCMNKIKKKYLSSVNCYEVLFSFVINVVMDQQLKNWNLLIPD